MEASSSYPQRWLPNRRKSARAWYEMARPPTFRFTPNQFRPKIGWLIQHKLKNDLPITSWRDFCWFIRTAHCFRKKKVAPTPNIIALNLPVQHTIHLSSNPQRASTQRHQPQHDDPLRPKKNVCDFLPSYLPLNSQQVYRSHVKTQIRSLLRMNQPQTKTKKTHNSNVTKGSLFLPVWVLMCAICTKSTLELLLRATCSTPNKSWHRRVDNIPR